MDAGRVTRDPREGSTSGQLGEGGRSSGGRRTASRPRSPAVELPAPPSTVDPCRIRAEKRKRRRGSGRRRRWPALYPAVRRSAGFTAVELPGGRPRTSAEQRAVAASSLRTAPLLPRFPSPPPMRRRHGLDRAPSFSWRLGGGLGSGRWRPLLRRRRRGAGTGQRQMNANAFAVPLLEPVEPEVNGKHCTHKANVNLPLQNGSYCWTQSNLREKCNA
jgi:hypothetical protein